jgi:Trm5-related predicted tRNA methylase
MIEGEDKRERGEAQLQNPPATKRSNRRKTIVMAPGPRILMDMQWGSLMNEHLQKKVIFQVSAAYSFNRSCEHSLPMTFTSVDQHWHELLHRVNAFQWSKEIVTFESKSLLDLIPPSDLVYLTPDTSNICRSLDPTKIYIIGCILDHNSKKGLTRDFAEANGIRIERLPIQENIVMDGRKTLTINHVAEILIRMVNGGSWQKAMIETIPSRRNPRPIAEETVEKKEERGIPKKSRCSVQ